MKAGKVVLNLELTPTQKSLKNIQQSFSKIGEKLFTPIKKIGKMFSAGAIMGAGKKVADGIFNIAKKQIMEPITTLTEVLERQINLQNKGNQLGIGASKQAGLDLKLSKVGLGGQLGDSIQSAFASALEGGKLAKYQRAGMIKGKDSADKLQSFLISLSKIKNTTARSVFSQDVFGTDISNALKESFEYSPFSATVGKGKNKKNINHSFSDLIGGEISGNSDNDRQIFRAQMKQQIAQARMGLLSVNKTDNLQGMAESTSKAKLDDFVRRLSEVNQTRIQAVTAVEKKIDEGMTKLGNGLTTLTNAMLRLAYSFEHKGFWKTIRGG